MATIEVLFPELLVKIFSHYVESEGRMEFSRNIPRVCKAWNKISSDSSLWKDVIAYDWNYLLNVSRRGLLEHTQSLKCDRYDESYSDTNLSSALKNIRDLKALDLLYMPVGGDTIMLVTEHCPHLECLSLRIMKPSKTLRHNLDHFITVCGPTLKDLDLDYYYSREVGPQLVSGIAAKCPVLERLKLYLGNAPFPIHELGIGCHRLRELEFSGCHLTTAGRNDSLGFGFKNIKKFVATYSHFGNLDVTSFFKDSMDLEHLELVNNRNLIFGNISNIPSDKIRILRIILKYPDDEDLKALEEAVCKWRHTLSVLDLSGWKFDIGCVLKHLVNENLSPQLESLAMYCEIDQHFFEEFIYKCQNLIHLVIGCKEYEGREEIERSFGISQEGKDS